MLALGLGLFGCASPGVPRPPSLHLPAPVKDLTAKRVGDHVQLQWTAPTRTTDGLDLTIPVTVEICRDVVRQASSSSQPSRAANPEWKQPCTPVMTLAGHPGVSTAIDPLPPALTTLSIDRPLIAYRIRGLNPAGRSADPSLAALVPGGSGPPPLAGFRAVQTRAGVLLEWQNSTEAIGTAEQPSVVEVLRSIQPRSSDSLGAQTATSAPKQKRLKSQSSNPFSRVQHDEPSAGVRLRQDAEESASSTRETPLPATPPRNLDGMVDRNAQQGAVYTYAAQRVLTVAVAGGPLEIRSEPTVPLVIPMRDTFPPAPPMGLVSIPGTKPPSAGEISFQATIDLAWDSNTETDLAGYLVYRSDQSTGASPIRLTPVPIPVSAYRDVTALPGHRYLYRVTAIDGNGNESALSTSTVDTTDGR